MPMSAINKSGGSPPIIARVSPADAVVETIGPARSSIPRKNVSRIRIVVEDEHAFAEKRGRRFEPVLRVRAWRDGQHVLANRQPEGPLSSTVAGRQTAFSHPRL